jgi:hypothetical protein
VMAARSSVKVSDGGKEVWQGDGDTTLTVGGGWRRWTKGEEDEGAATCHTVDGAARYQEKNNGAVAHSG